MFRSLPIEQACRQIAQLGYEAIDIWSAHEGCPHLDDVAKRLGPDGLKAVLEETKLRLCCFSVYAGGYPRYAELLGQAGGGLAIRESEYKPGEPKEITARMRGFLESLKPQLELAAGHRSRLAIENHGSALLNTLDSLKAFVDLNSHRHLGIALAPYHLQAAKASVEEAIAICGSQLFYFYAWQHAGGFQQLPGHGPTDFTPWLKALAQVNYQGFVNPFMHGEAEVEVMSKAVVKSRGYLRDCCAKALAAGA
jgi:sugar phosphate isomerase/epimerase